MTSKTPESVHVPAYDPEKDSDLMGSWQVVDYRKRAAERAAKEIIPTTLIIQYPNFDHSDLRRGPLTEL